MRRFRNFVYADCYSIDVQYVWFFRRKHIEGISGHSERFQCVRAENVDEFAFFPVVSGLWKQHELWDGTYTVDDLFDIHEMLMVKNENEARSREYYSRGER